jgi:iron(III) transport system ATP-binding protein
MSVVEGPVLELVGLTKRFGNVVAVDQVSFTIEPGEIFTLLGPSGCGKSTTLRLVAGLEQPDGGSLQLRGKTIASAAERLFLPPERRNMGMVFQSYAIWPHMTVFENVAFPLQLRHWPKQKIREAVSSTLGIVGLEGLEERPATMLSGGQQQRVALARALVYNPDILLLDEPLSNLDANLREEMRFEIRRLHDKFRYTTVYVTHDQAEAMTTADLIVVMNQGAIEQAGVPEEIYQRPRTEFVARFIGGTNIFKGRWNGQDTVACANGLVMRCAEGDFAPQGDTAVSVRHHDIRLTSAAPEPGQANWTGGTVARQVYLGSHRDYLVALADGETVRTITPVNVSIEPGQPVWLHFPPEHCRALAR